MLLRRREFLASLTAGAVAVTMQHSNAQLCAADRAAPVTRIPTREQIRARSPDGWKLVDTINEHRRQHRLPAIDLSPRLTTVAYWHAKVLAERRPQDTYGSLHSWSVDERWRGGAYRSDDPQTMKIMWDKPKEITGYTGLGFEICASEARDLGHAFELWTQSAAHHQVILNQGVWAEARWRWRALGAVFYKGYACAWFGSAADAG